MDPMTAQFTRRYNIPLDHLDFRYISACTDVKELENIYKVLLSGEEGRYPDLEAHCEARISLLAPNSRVLRKEQPPLCPAGLDKSEWANISADLNAWTASCSKAGDAEKASADAEDSLPPVRAANATISLTASQKNAAQPQPASGEKPGSAAAKRPMPRSYDEWSKLEKQLEAQEERDAAIAADEAAVKRASSSSAPAPAAAASQPATRKVPALASRVRVDGLSTEERQRLAEHEKAKGNEAFRSGDFEEAALYYSRSISASPLPASYNNRAFAYLKLQKYTACVKDCAKVLKAEPNNVKALLRRATAYQKIHRSADARSDLDHLMRLDPNNTAGAALLAEVEAEQAKRGKPSGAKRMVIEEVGSSEEEDEEEPLNLRNNSTIITANGNSVAPLKPSQPQVSQPQVSQPQVSQPLVSQPQVSQPKVSQPQVSQPKVSQPQVSQPQVSQPQVSQPQVSQPQVSQPQVSQPQVSQPQVSQPQVSQPLVSQPQVSQPLVSQPQVSQPKLQPVEPIAQPPGPSQPPKLEKSQQASKDASVKSQSNKPTDSKKSKSKHLRTDEASPSEPPMDEFEAAKEAGNRLFKAGNYARAMEHYNRCTELRPDDPVSYTNRAVCCIKLDRPNDAVYECNMALELEPANMKAIFRRGVARKMLGFHRESLMDLNLAKSFDPLNKQIAKEIAEVEAALRKSSGRRVLVEEIEDEDDEEPIDMANTEEPPVAVIRDVDGVVSESVLPAASQVDSATDTMELTPDKATDTADLTSPCFDGAQAGDKSASTDNSTSTASSDNKSTLPLDQPMPLTKEKIAPFVIDKSAATTDVGRKSTEKLSTAPNLTFPEPVGDQPKVPVASVAAATTAPAPTLRPDCSPFEFTQAWLSASRSSSLSSSAAVHADLLTLVEPDRLPRLLSNKLDGPLLAQIVAVVRDCLAVRDPRAGARVLLSIPAAERFDFVAMFLDAKEKADLSAALAKLESLGAVDQDEMKKLKSAYKL